MKQQNLTPNDEPHGDDENEHIANANLQVKCSRSSAFISIALLLALVNNATEQDS